MNNSFDWKKIVDRIFFVYFGWTQKDIAENLHVSQDLISGWKKGKSKPTWEIIEKVAEWHGIDFQWLVFGKSANISTLIQVYSDALINESVNDLIRERADETAKLALAEKVFIIHHPTQYDTNYAEVANRLYFLSCHKVTSLNLMKDIELKGLTYEKYVMQPQVLEMINTVGYQKFKSGHKIIQKAFLDYSVDISLMKYMSISYRVDFERIKSPPTEGLPALIADRSSVEGMDEDFIREALLQCLAAQTGLNYLSRYLAGDKSVSRKDFDPKSLRASFETLTSLVEGLRDRDKTRDRKKA